MNDKMKTSYNNYLGMERKNIKNHFRLSDSVLLGTSRKMSLHSI